MRFLNNSRGIVLALIAACSCIEPYDPELRNEDVNYLVVDAFLNGSDGVATVRLSRTLPVKSTDPIPRETGADVYIEHEGGLLYPLAHEGEGTYTGDVNLSGSDRYRLVIRIGDEHEYVSGYTTIQQTPPIDSITWSVHRDGIQFEVNTHDATKATRHFKWRFTETYEYHARLQSLFMIEDDTVVERPPDLSLTFCWRSHESSNIMIRSLTHLDEPVLNNNPLTLIPWGSRKLFVKYSILVQQHALTEETYNYWHNLSKTTENLGGLFDPLPSEVEGNITCTHHDGEKALGIFSAATVSEKRMFLSNGQLPPSLAREFMDLTYCTIDTLLLEDVASASQYMLLVDEILGPDGPEPIGWGRGTSQCIDCTYWGGVTTEPSFWE